MRAGKIYTAAGAGHRQRYRRKPGIRANSVFINIPPANAAPGDSHPS
jgi:hypothetical protein